MSDPIPGSTEEGVLAVLEEAMRVPVAALVEQPVLAAHDWDSLTSLFALARLEGRFAITLDLRAFHAARTVADLVRLVALAGGAAATQEPTTQGSP